MKGILLKASRRWGYSGWAIKVKGTALPLNWTFCTTRQEVREVRDEAFRNDLFCDVEIEIVKVKVRLEAC